MNRRLSVSKEALIVSAISILLVSEVLAGALRFFLGQVGLPVLAYFGKAVLLVAILAKLPRIATNLRALSIVFVMLLAGANGLYHGAGLENLAFAIFVYLPLAFGLLYGSQLARVERQLSVLILLAWAISMLGVLLELVIDVPWKGYEYELAGVALEANRDWVAGEFARIAGFTRLSTTLAIMLAVFALYLHHQVRALSVRIGLFLLTATGILFTTTKSVFAAYVATMLCVLLFRFPRVRDAICSFVVVIGLLLPLCASFLSAVGFGDYNYLLLASFDDRLVTTWPKFFFIVEKSDAAILGTGLGTVGAANDTFPIYELWTPQYGDLSFADNTALYLWGMLGVVGVALYLGLVPAMRNLAHPTRRSSYSMSLLSITVCLCIIGWTTDILEASVASMFLGFSVSHAFSRRRQEVVSTRSRKRTGATQVGGASL